MDATLALVAAGHLRTEPLITHTMPLSGYAEAVDLLRLRQAVKVAFLPH